MNKPQLSAEMEIVTKFRQFLANWDYAHLTRKVSVEESRQMCDEFALTLATALEEQRKQVLDEVEKLVGDIYDGSDWHTGRHALVDELRTKLNQLKRGK